MKTKTKILFFMIFIFYSSIINGQIRHLLEDRVFVGYLDGAPAFFERYTWSVATFVNNVEVIKKNYHEGLFVQEISNEMEVLYCFINKEYTIILEKDTFIIENIFETIAVDAENRVLFASMPRNDQENSLRILRIDLDNNIATNTGLTGYVHRVVGNFLIYFIETNPQNADSPYNIYRVNHDKLEDPELIFYAQAINLDFQVSNDGSLFYGRNYQKEVVIEIGNKKEQIIKERPLYNSSELAPYFSYDNNLLIFYEPKNMMSKSIKVENLNQ